MKTAMLKERVEIVKVSSKGQVVLPKSIREKLHIEKGSFVAVVQSDGAVILKKISGMTKDDYKTLLKIKESWNQIEQGKYKRFKSAKEFSRYIKTL